MNEIHKNRCLQDQGAVGIAVPRGRNGFSLPFSFSRTGIASRGWSSFNWGRSKTEKSISTVLGFDNCSSGKIFWPEKLPLRSSKAKPRRAIIATRKIILFDLGEGLRGIIKVNKNKLLFGG